MEIEKFIENYREAFGEAAGLPVVFWYSDEETGHTKRSAGVFLKVCKRFVPAIRLV